MLLEQEIKVDECYTAVWRESKHTLIHCAKGCRLSPEALTKAIDELKISHGISLQATIIGYDSLTSMNKQKINTLEDHPGFKKITELLNMRSEDVKCWIEGEHNVYEYRKGSLWKSIEITDPTKMTQRQLAALVKAWAPIVNGNDTLKAAFEAQSASFQEYKEQNDSLKASLKQMHEIVARNKKEINELYTKEKLLHNQIINAGLVPVDMQGSKKQ